MKCTVENLKTRKVSDHEFSQVPGIGEYIVIDEDSFIVQLVFQIADFKAGDPVAIIRVLP